MRVILFQPQIPQNTGNIVRTCSVTGTDLTLVKPLGFSINDRWLKRAGLDYWEGVSVEVIDDLLKYIDTTNSPFTFFSSKAKISYSSLSFHPDHLLIFGSETSGLPSHLLERYPNRFATIPMLSGKRSLNLATSVGIVLYEAWRQQGFRLNKSNS
jgi:tRNA (cytidine/uridine-2'-O-)-methyltransferase